jgi:hypothetical protein
MVDRNSLIGLRVKMFSEVSQTLFFTWRRGFVQLLCFGIVLLVNWESESHWPLLSPEKSKEVNIREEEDSKFQQNKEFVWNTYIINIIIHG